MPVYAPLLWLKLCCWPPCCCCCPSIAAARLSLFPPDPSYNVNQIDDDEYELEMRNPFSATRMVLPMTTCTYGYSKRRNNIFCVYIKCSVPPRYVILHSHGNSIDIGHELYGLFHLGNYIDCDVFTYDYSGYGRSGGKPSVKNLYADIRCALEVLNSNYYIPSESVVLIGHSIGSVPTVDIASKTNFAGVVLLSPLTSAFRTLCPKLKKNLACDVYKNIVKIPKVTAPVLVVHGTEDEIIDVTQAHELYRRCAKPVSPLWVNGVGHHDLELYHFARRLERFVSVEAEGTPIFASPQE